MSPSPNDTIAIDAFLSEHGFRDADPRRLARITLEEAGLTRPGKSGIAAGKLGRARDALAARWLRVCGQDACLAVATTDGRLQVSVPRDLCDVCGGSNNQVAMRRMADACRRAGVRHLLIVGGRPPSYEQLGAALKQHGLELRFVDGTQPAPTQKEAWVNCDWADLVVIWAPTPLPHKVSNRYARAVCDADRVEVHRRGIEALAGEVTRHLSGRIRN